MDASRRDSRTDEQRAADDEREREFHRKRAEAGLPPLHYAAEVVVQLEGTISDEAQALGRALDDATTLFVDERRREGGGGRGPYYSGGAVIENEVRVTIRDVTDDDALAFYRRLRVEAAEALSALPSHRRVRFVREVALVIAEQG